MKKLLILATALFSINALATPVDINTADANTIADSLSGIGLKKAQAIVDYRAKNGNFNTLEDLTHVSGIGTKTIEKNKTDILLAAPAPAAAPPADPAKKTDLPETSSKKK
ncbi:MAG: helix-hairpin-helix domain-containing protein [Methylococcales bacterium]|nr:helix-hairpin-helix domain-containing protein [Methylococcales bacterium]